MEHEEILQVWSDLHKDVYGFRPHDWDRVRNLSLDDLRAEYDRMVEDLDREIEREEAAHQRAAKLFEQRVLETIDLGAGTRETAIRWIADGEDVYGDLDYLEYKCGLKYGYLKGNR